MQVSPGSNPCFTLATSFLSGVVKQYDTNVEMQYSTNPSSILISMFLLPRPLRASKNLSSATSKKPILEYCVLFSFRTTLHSFISVYLIAVNQYLLDLTGSLKIRANSFVTVLFIVRYTTTDGPFSFNLCQNECVMFTSIPCAGYATSVVLTKMVTVIFPKICTYSKRSCPCTACSFFKTIVLCPFGIVSRSGVSKISPACKPFLEWFQSIF